MLLMLVFACGVANFALGKALVESRHPVMRELPRAFRRNGGAVPLIFEFLVLLAALLMAGSGWAGAAWLYGAYTAVNAMIGWMIHTGRL